MASEKPSPNPIARLFKTDPFRDLFHTLADTLEFPVLVIHGEEPRPITCNHQFLLLTGFARGDLDRLLLSDLFGGSSALNFSACWDNPGVEFQDVPLKTQSGDSVAADIIAHPISSSRAAILLEIRPSIQRQQILELEAAERERLSTLAQVAELASNQAAVAIPTMLDLARRPLNATHAAIYRISSGAPDYVIEGTLPPEFPETIAAATLGPLRKSTIWVRGQRPEHELQKAARASNLEALHTSLIGEENAWIGLMLVAWQDANQIPKDMDPIADVLSNLLHIAVSLSLLREATAESQFEHRRIEAELWGQFQAISDTMISVDSQLEVTRANLSIARLLGYQPSEVEGHPIQDVLVGPEDVTPTLLDALGHDREAERSRLILHRRDGTPVPVYLRAIPLIGHDGSSLLLVLRDQSEQQAIEDQTEILAQRALLGEVTAIFAHEVRNPINNISTGVQLIASRLGEEHPQYAALDRVRQECVRLDQLMTDVLFFARPLELKMEAADLTDIVNKILGRWGPRFAQSSIRCHTSFEPGIPKTSADPRTLERVIVNLISNALEAMSPGGTLSVAIAAITTSQGEMVELKVADTGSGIPPDKVDRIFDPFFTTKKDGTGLGLAISRRIMTAHKGTIQVESFPDAGTVFTIQLPVTART